MLSQRMVGLQWGRSFSSLRMLVTQLSSATAAATTRYSASVDDRAIVLCSFEHQLLGIGPSYTT